MHSLPNDSIIETSRSELEVLNGLVDHAENMIADGRQVGPYASLRRYAYGKTVVLETEKKGRLTFRVTQVAAVPNAASNCATPHSPVGRLCSFLRPGDEDESPAWGEYRVVESRLFDRFDGVQFENNVRNFLRMVVDGEAGRASASDLLRTVRQGIPSTPVVAAPPLPVLNTESVASPSIPAPLPPAIALAHLEVVEEEEPLDASILEFDDAEDSPEQDRAAAEEYYGLSEVFYLNRTRAQDQVIARSPIGAMFVEGVAGSGKTSAALGRTKMLCDFNEQVVTEEKAFREIAGNSLEHWSGRFAGRFSQEGSIGFVRTGELIQYLRETCRRIDLPNLPVADYKELQVRLSQHRKLERSRTPGGRWGHLDIPRNTEFETTMEWLQAADRALSAIFANKLDAGLPQAEEMAELFVADKQPVVSRVIEVGLAALRENLSPIQTILRRGPAIGRFGLDKLAVNLNRAIQQVRDKILSKEVLWVFHGTHAYHATNEHALAALLIRRRVPLYSRSPARLVVVDEQGPVDKSMVFLMLSGAPIDWSEEARPLLMGGQLVVREADGQAMMAIGIETDKLFLKLLPEAIDKLYLRSGGRLMLLQVRKGLGRHRFELLRPQEDEPEEDVPAEGAVETDAQATAPQPDQHHRSIDSLFKRVVEKALFEPVVHLADAYRSTLDPSLGHYPDADLAQRIHLQMQEKKFSEQDVDLLLCLTHVIGREFKGKPVALTTPAPYQSVFIDEVQDFTEQQVFLMAEQANTEYRAVTVVGDLAQKLHHGSGIDIRACFPGQELAQVNLDENLRQLDAPGLAWFSACFRAAFHDGTDHPQPSGELLKRLHTQAKKVCKPEMRFYDDDAALDREIVEVLLKVTNGQTAAVILPDGNLASETHHRLRTELANKVIYCEHSEKVDLSRRHIRHFTSVLNAKGLEFDVVVLPYLERYDLEDRAMINRLYVGLTRARRRLVLLAQADWRSPRFEAVWEHHENVLAGL